MATTSTLEMLHFGDNGDGRKEWVEMKVGGDGDERKGWVEMEKEKNEEDGRKCRLEEKDVGGGQGYIFLYFYLLLYIFIFIFNSFRIFLIKKIRNCEKIVM